MDNSIHLKYLTINQDDLKWGITINSVGYQNIAAGMPYPPENHPPRYLFSTDSGRTLNEYQLLYITKGKGRFTSKTVDRTIHISEGNMFLLFPGEWHNYSPDPSTGWEEHWIGFEGQSIENWVSNKLLTPDKPVLKVGIHDEIVNLYRSAVEAALEQKSGFQQVLSGIVHHILGLAYCYDRNFVFESSEVSLINRAKIIINEHFTTIHPQAIADELNMSYSNFRRIFKEYTGFAPIQYIQTAKISKAKELLTNSPLSIKEIAWQLGFENHEYFFSIFKKKTGCTPAEYRRLTQGHI